MPAGVAALKSMKQLDKNDVDRFLIHGVRVETPQMLRATHYDPHEYAWLNNGEEFDALGAPRPEFTPFEISFDDLTGEFNLVDPDGEGNFIRKPGDSRILVPEWVLISW